MSKRLNLDIDLSDLKNQKGEPFLEEENKITFIFNFIEQSLASGYEKGMTSDEQRKLIKFMSKIEGSKDGEVELTDTEFAYLLDRWEKRKLRVMIGNERKFLERIDRVIAEDEYKD